MQARGREGDMKFIGKADAFCFYSLRQKIWRLDDSSQRRKSNVHVRSVNLALVSRLQGYAKYH